MKKKSYVIFRRITSEGKTLKILVKNPNNEKIGMIIFWGAWRKYIFQPEANTIFDSACLNDVIGELDRLNYGIRQEWQQRKKNK